MKEILIVSEAHLIRTFVLPTLKRLREEARCVFDCFIVTPIDSKTQVEFEGVFRKVYSNPYPKGIFRKIPWLRAILLKQGLKILAKQLPDYDIAHIHYHHHYYSLFTPILRKKTRKLFLTFFGSDFNGIEPFKHKNNQITVNLADGIFTTNETLLEKIITQYKLKKSGKTTGTMVPLMDSFIHFQKFLSENDKTQAKARLNFEKKIMVCGYSAARITQHEKIIDVLKKLKHKLDGYKIVFPMTYGAGGDQPRKQVKESLKNSSLDYLVLEDFLPLEKLLALRLAADVFIHIQTRDQMAASMLEHLAAGSVVITGDWLPYQMLKDKGAYFIQIKKPEDLEETLWEVLNNYSFHKTKAEVNKRIILNMMSWETIRENWYTYYELEPKQ